MTRSLGEKRRPGTLMLSAGIAVLALGFVLLLVNLANPVTNYVAGAGLVTTQGPSTGSIVLIIAGILTSAIGFGRRVLSAIEK